MGGTPRHAQPRRFFDTAFQGATAREGAVSLVLLLTDGEPNTDGDPFKTPSEAAETVADRLKDADVRIFAWGFGSVDESTLESVATPPTANFSYVFKSPSFATISTLVDTVCEVALS